MRRSLMLAALVAAVFAACGGDDEEPSAERRPAAAEDLGAIKTYLLDHTQRLKAEVFRLRAGAEEYHRLAASSGFDGEKLLGENRAGVARVLARAKEDFKRANPAYEEMEGVVAGVPELADYDVIIDAGGDASDPEAAVPFSIRTEDGRTFKQPGNLFFLIETALYGTEPKFAARGDLDGDGRVEFGEGLPDPRFYLAAAREFEKSASELDAAARKWTPTEQDAFTALVVMTPTMSEYFEAWKNSRFVAGEKASEKAFVGASRLQDIADILGGLQLIYANVQDRVASVNPQQARQTGLALRELEEFAADLRDQEAKGERFTGEDADQLGSEAQTRAEAIAGQVSQAAGRLGVELET